MPGPYTYCALARSTAREAEGVTYSISKIEACTYISYCTSDVSHRTHDDKINTHESHTLDLVRTPVSGVVQPQACNQPANHERPPTHSHTGWLQAGIFKLAWTRHVPGPQGLSPGGLAQLASRLRWGLDSAKLESRAATPRL